MVWQKGGYSTNEQMNELGVKWHDLLLVWRPNVIVLAFAVLVLAIIFAPGQHTGAQASHRPFFSPYVDVTATPEVAFQGMGAALGHDVALSFIVSSPSNVCTPSWGAVYSLGQADTVLGLGNRIRQFQKQGGNAMVGFGGYSSQELATGCTDMAKLTAAYRSVVDRYNLRMIDLDLEGAALADSVNTRRALAIANLQLSMLRAGRPLAVWVTLPVAVHGLDNDAVNAVRNLLQSGANLAGINLMTMDFGAHYTARQPMAELAESAVMRAASQISTEYRRAGWYFDDTALWARIGITPMIGRNDTPGQVLTLADAEKLHEFAVSHGMGRISMWSANRDAPCPSIMPSMISNACSGTEQKVWDFASVLGAELKR